MLSEQDIRQLRSLINFPALVAFLRDQLHWPLEADNIEDLADLTYTYGTDELGIAPQYAAKIERIRQLRNLVDNQPWGIFYIEFDSRRLPVGALRRILNAFVASRRLREADRPVWNLSDLLFICVQGAPGRRGVAFAHFRQAEGENASELRTFSWDSQESHFYYLERLNLAQLHWPEDDSNHEAWRQQWRSAFTARHREIITTSEKLASAMAEHAVIIRESISDRYGVETDEGPLHSLFKRFRELLLHDLTPEAFADMVAQTITYGLFSAAEQTPDLTYERMVELIPKTNPFLKQLLAALKEDAGLDLNELGVGPLLNLLRAVPVAQIAQDFGRQTASGQEDPVVHFYEQFLQEYDRQQRVERGVFYTPDPVVSYIVRAVDDLLKSEFGIAEGLASAERDSITGEHKVQILDPATGTGTFLAHIIDRIATAQNAADTPAWNDYVAKDLLPRLNGFELMMAPYTIAHMKLGLKLRQTGYNFESDERLRVFLTNALEEPLEAQETLKIAGFLSQESDEAASVKRARPVMVVLGNPPYSNFGQLNQNRWILELLTDYKKGLEERKINLNDDYVKFLRFGQWRIEKTGKGVLAFITNNSFLDGITHRQMRRSLMETFDQLFILNLHGSSMVQETAPDGAKDENVFDIRQGVSISIFVKNGSQVIKNKTYICDVWANRKDKYDYLNTIKFKATNWKEIQPQSPEFFFVDKDFLKQTEYQSNQQVTKFFCGYSSGIQTKRDKIAIADNSQSLKNTLEDFVSLESETIRKKYQLPADGRDWRIEWASQHARKILNSNEGIVECLYRPFDIKWTVIDDTSKGFVAYSRYGTMRHMLSANLALISTRQLSSDSFRHIFVTQSVIDGNTISLQTREYNYLFNLYNYPQRGQLIDASPWKLSDKGRRPNLDPAFVQELVDKLDLSFITDGRGDLQTTFGPEDIFHYAYAVFHSPAYRQRYAEFLKIDFPRLPLTGDVALFRKLAQLGADLVALHLLEDDYAAASWNLEGEDSPLAQTGVDFVLGSNSTTVGAMGKSSAWQKGCVYIDTSHIQTSSHFTGVPEAVWNFHVGGYQVCHKWLYDRRGNSKEPGRSLTPEDIEHYKRIVAALRETILLMEAIDRAIDNHGGWPLAGSQPDVEEEEDEMTLLDDREPGFTSENLEDILNQQFGVESETEDAGEKRDVQPFDPTLIRVDTRPLTIDLLIKRIRNRETNLNPDFQRMGGIWNDSAQSRLIESLLIRIPLPAFYMDASNDDEWLVIDGLQRLTALKRFIIDQTLKLHGLEFWREYNGLTYDGLPRPLQRRIEETQITLYLVQKGTPHNVKFNIFKRINTGGVPLSGQEIRHALNLGASTDLLIELAKSDEFLQATDFSVSPKRMTDRELVLRFLSFILRDYTSYSSRDELDPFLNDRMQEINQLSAEDIDILRQRFLRAMRVATDIFGNNAFRKQYRGVARRSPISKALFEVWSVNFDRLDDAQITQLTRCKENLNERFLTLMADPEFFNAITTSTGDPRRINIRFSEIERIIQETLDA